jgi:Leucine-rich repeat (LRR) protein
MPFAGNAQCGCNGTVVFGRLTHLNITSTPPITSLSLAGNRVDAIEEGWLKGGDNINTLNLMQNNLPVFSLSVLSGFHNLTVVDVRFNQIERVGRGDINCSLVPTMQQVLMRGNPCIYVHAGAVVNCSKLSSIDLNIVKCPKDTTMTTVSVGANNTATLQVCECRSGYQCVDRHVTKW